MKTGRSYCLHMQKINVYLNKPKYHDKPLYYEQIILILMIILIIRIILYKMFIRAGRQGPVATGRSVICGIQTDFIYNTPLISEVIHFISWINEYVLSLKYYNMC